MGSPNEIPILLMNLSFAEKPAEILQHKNLLQAIHQNFPPLHTNAIHGGEICSCLIGLPLISGNGAPTASRGPDNILGTIAVTKGSDFLIVTSLCILRSMVHCCLCCFSFNISINHFSVFCCIFCNCQTRRCCVSTCTRTSHACLLRSLRSCKVRLYLCQCGCCLGLQGSIICLTDIVHEQWNHNGCQDEDDYDNNNQLNQCETFFAVLTLVESLC